MIKTIVYNLQPVNNRTRFVYQGYVFGFDRNLRPIPVEVPEEIATVLLQMEGRRSACCPERGGGPLFSEI